MSNVSYEIFPTFLHVAISVDYIDVHSVAHVHYLHIALYFRSEQWDESEHCRMKAAIINRQPTIITIEEPITIELPKQEQ